MSDPAPFAVSGDLEARWRPLTSAESSVAPTLLADASQMIRDRWPDTDVRVAAGSLSALSLTRVVCAMVKRSLVSGDATGVTQESQGAGPFNRALTFANPMGDLYLKADEILLLEGNGYTPRVRMGWLA